MLLTQLLGPEIAAPAAATRRFVTGLTADSRQVAPGFVFAALPGSKVDGARFIADAAEKGAIAIVAGKDAVVPAGVDVPVLRVEIRAASWPSWRHAFMSASQRSRLP